LLAHLAHKKEPMYFCKSSGDEGSRVINRKIIDFISDDPANRKLVNLKRDGFLNLLASVKCIIGNSSAGIYEAPPLGTPTINVGGRQDGRLRASSIINCAASSSGLRAAFGKLDAIAGLPITTMLNGGPVSERILNVIKKYNRVDLQKGFYDN